MTQKIVDPLTDEEHEARCMLLGRNWMYRPTRGYYVDMSGPMDKGFERLDCITLEPLGTEEWSRRINAASSKERYYDRAIR